MQCSANLEWVQNVVQEPFVRPGPNRSNGGVSGSWRGSCTYLQQIPYRKSGFDGFAVTLDEFAKLFCRRERDQVARDKELIVKARGGELNFSLIFVAAKND